MVPRVAIISIAATMLMAWLVQPRVARLLEGWLYGPATKRTAGPMEESRSSDLWPYVPTDVAARYPFGSDQA